MKNLIIFLAILATLSTQAQVIYSNGELATGPRTARNDLAPLGYQWSEVQANAGDLFTCNALLGNAAVYNNAGTLNLLISDDFTIPTGETWNINSFDFFGYATDFGLTPAGNPIDVLRVAIYDGKPSLPTSNLIAGSLTNNVIDLANSPEAFLYRVDWSIGDVGVAPVLNKKLWKMRGNLQQTLSSGTYWVIWQVHAVDDFGIFFAPNTIIGNRGLPNFNAIIRNNVTNVWVPSFDQDVPASAPNYNMDYPFKINGTISTLSTNDNILSDKFKVYPNPANNLINLDSEIEINSIEIIDIFGRIIKEKSINSKSINLDISDLSAGNYLLKINSLNGVLTKKISKI
jgi:Secretion system C-terminal sorting domain